MSNKPAVKRTPSSCLNLAMAQRPHASPSKPDWPAVSHPSQGALLTLNSVSVSRSCMTTTSCMCLLRTARAGSAGCWPLKKVLNLLCDGLSEVPCSSHWLGSHSRIKDSWWSNISSFWCWWRAPTFHPEPSRQQQVQGRVSPIQSTPSF